MTTDTDELLTTEDAARWLKVHQNTVHQYVAEGMPHIRLGTATVRPRFRFRKADILRWMERHAPAAGSTP